MRGHGVQVLVVGAGLAGLATARTLRDWGATVQIIERSPRPQPRGAGIYLPGNAVQALERLGLAAEVAARAVRIRRQRVSDRRGRLLFDIDVEDIWQGVGTCLALPRAGLHQVFLDRTTDIPIHWATTPQAITNTRDDVRVDLSDGSSAAFDLVVGADGVHSTVRHMVFPDGGARPIGLLAYRFLARWPGATPTWSLMMGDRSAFLTIPVSDEQIYCYCDGPATDPPPTLHELARAFGEPVPTILHGEDVRAHHAPLVEVNLERWSDGVVVLVGDAAHATSPNMAQGGAMAFEDAIVLAQSLSRATTITDALRTYEQRRRPRTDWVMAQTRRRDRTRGLSPRLRNLLYRRAGRRMFQAHHRPLRTAP